MSEIQIKAPIPLDDEGYLRRECPLCKKQFKILLKEEEKQEFQEIALKSFMTDNDDDNDDILNFEPSCPYCGQKAPENNWWTEEQIEYFNSIFQNIMADILNKQLLQPLRRMSNSVLTFEGKDIKKEETWISPEPNDMESFNLDCCERKIKIEEVEGNTVFCFYCGFPHKK